MIRKKHTRTILTCIAPLLLAFLLFNLILNTQICAASYTVFLSNLDSPVRLVLLSDLHGQSFGRDNTRLIAKIREQAPDAICLAGDMLGRNAEAQDVKALLQLVEQLCELAPVYFAPGNHEQEYMETDDTLLMQVAEAGAVVVNDSYADAVIAGQPLRIGGTMGHAFYFGRTEEEFTSSPEYRFLKDFENTDVPKICLAHMPDTFIFNGAYQLWDVDLVLSGHTHGGLIRLPFVGGLYAPMQGWLPEYDCGWFRLGDHMQMVITAGLAGHDIIPRINNPPEIAVIELVPTSER